METTLVLDRDGDLGLIGTGQRLDEIVDAVTSRRRGHRRQRGAFVQVDQPFLAALTRSAANDRVPPITAHPQANMETLIVLGEQDRRTVSLFGS